MFRNIKVRPRRLEYSHLILGALFFAAVCAFIASRLELGSVWAAWIQAVGSVILLIFAVGVPAVDRRREQSALQERIIEESKGRFKTLYVQVSLAHSVFDLAVGRLGSDVWCDKLHQIEAIDSLVRRIEQADVGDNHPTRATMRQSIIVALLDLRALLRLDPIQHDSSREALYKARQQALFNIQHRLEAMPGIGINERMASIHG